MQNLHNLGISTLDVVALLWFVGVWVSYSFLARYRCNVKKVGLVAEMNIVRKEWALEILNRENRQVDSQLINGLIRKETFFASTTILIIASTLALMGVGDEVFDLFDHIPFAIKTSNTLWMLKVVVLIIVFMFAFFKFTWSIHQRSYCANIIGSIPAVDQKHTKQALGKANKLSNLNNLAAKHFNGGMRAYYFALAELSWFYHPLVFIFATTWVVIILYRREFHSKALEILRQKDKIKE